MTVVIAHRGASGYLPEHTLTAKAAAHAMEVDFLEQDCVSSKDGVPFVLHDIHIDTVTNVAKVLPERRRADGRFYAIDFTADELSRLQVYERFDPATGRAVFPKRFPTGQGDFGLPSLEEELRFIANLNLSTGREVGIYPEIKRPAWHREQGIDLSQEVLKVLANYGYVEKDSRCFVQCFDENEVVRIRKELGYGGKLVQLVYHGHDEESGTDYQRLKSPEGMASLVGVADGIGPSIDAVATWENNGIPKITSFVDHAHDQGLVVHPWTYRADSLPPGCPSGNDCLDVLINQAKVDGLFADHPDHAVKFIRGSKI